jgi:hypothetical protein
MSSRQAIGLVLLVCGGIVFIRGMSLPESDAARQGGLFTAIFSEPSSPYVIGGVAFAVAGLLLASAERLRTPRRNARTSLYHHDAASGESSARDAGAPGRGIRSAKE